MAANRNMLHDELEIPQEIYVKRKGNSEVFESLDG